MKNSNVGFIFTVILLKNIGIYAEVWDILNLIGDLLQGLRWGLLAFHAISVKNQRNFITRLRSVTVIKWQGGLTEAS